MGQLSRQRKCTLTYECLRSSKTATAVIVKVGGSSFFYFCRKFSCNWNQMTKCREGRVHWLWCLGSEWWQCLGKTVQSNIPRQMRSVTLQQRLEVASGGNIVHSISHKYSEMPAKRILTCKFALTRAFFVSLLEFAHCILIQEREKKKKKHQVRKYLITPI